MPRRALPPEARRADVQPDQMREALPRLRRRIEELRALEVSSIEQRSDPRIVALEQRINSTLGDIFGHDTFEYREFGDVQLDRASQNLYRPTPMTEVREGLSRGVAAAVASLEGLVVLFEEKLGGAEAQAGAASHAPYDRRQQLVLASQRNAVLEAVTAAGLDPADFHWGEQHSRFEAGLSVSRLAHLSSGAFFDFDFKNGKPFAHMRPGKEHPEEFQWPGAWNGQLQCVHQWLGYLRRELSAPDLWAAFTASLQEMAGPAFFESDPSHFSPEEMKHVSKEIQDLRSHFGRDFDLTQQQLQLVSERLGLLEEAVRQQTRQGWWLMALGVCLSLVLAVPSFQQQLDQVVGYFRVLLASVFTRGPAPEGQPVLPPEVV